MTFTVSNLFRCHSYDRVNPRSLWLENLWPWNLTPENLYIPCIPVLILSCLSFMFRIYHVYQYSFYHVYHSCLDAKTRIKMFTTRSHQFLFQYVPYYLKLDLECIEHSWFYPISYVFYSTHFLFCTLLILVTWTARNK